MPRATEAIIPTRFILSEAEGAARSRDYVFMIGVADPGALLSVHFDSSPPYATPVVIANNANGILIERSPTAGARYRVMLTRDAEVNDAYIHYGNFNRGAVNLALAVNANIIVREAIAERSGIAGIFDPVPEPDGVLPDEPVVDATDLAIPATSGPPASPAGWHGWALVLTFHRFVFGAMFRWGRRR